MLNNLKRFLNFEEISFFLKQNKIILLVSLILLSEFLNKTILKLNIYDFRISFILKVIFVLYATALLFLGKNKKLLYTFLVLIGYLLIELIFKYKTIDFHFFNYGLRYLFYIFCIVFLLKHNNLNRYNYLIFFDILILVNSCLILLGFIYEIQFFKTYYKPVHTRFGFNGLLNMVSDTNYIYVLYALLNYLYFELKPKKYKILLYFNLFVSILTGTKTVIVVSLFVLVLLSFKKTGKILRAAGGLMLILVYFFYDKIYDILRPTMKIFARITEDQGMLSAITSYRFFNLKRSLTSYFGDTDFTDILFYHTNFINMRVEMELFDVILYWGLIGVIIYSLSFVAINRTVIKNKKEMYILGALFFVAFFVGKFLTNFSAIFITYTFFTLKDKKIIYD